MNLPSRDTREAWAKLADNERDRAYKEYRPNDRAQWVSLAAFLRSDTLDRMAEAIRAADDLINASGLSCGFGLGGQPELQKARDAYRAARAKLED